MVHPSAGTYIAFSAVCTHAGCSVQYDQSTVQFVCPCHGGIFDARTCAVRSGPPPGPLQRIPVTVAGGQLLVDA
jgi:Rieske Fe-S protein